jgi:hypothetical protein
VRVYISLQPGEPGMPAAHRSVACPVCREPVGFEVPGAGDEAPSLVGFEEAELSSLR